MRSITAVVGIAFAGLFALAQRSESPLTYERVRNAQAEPQNWLMYWGNYQGTHFSSLKALLAFLTGVLEASTPEARPAGHDGNPNRPASSAS